MVMDGGNFVILGLIEVDTYIYDDRELRVG